MMLAIQSFYSPRRAGVVLTLLGLLGLLGLVFDGAPAFADGPPTGTADQQIKALLSAKEQRTPAQRKVSSQLLVAAEQLAEAEGSGQPPEAEGSEQPRRSVPPGRQQAADPDSVAELELVTVDIRANVTAAVLARIRALGGTVINSVPEHRAIRARLPLAAVEPLAALDAVQFIRPADEAVTRKDDTSEGDAAHLVDAARTAHGVTGAGIGIGVLSDGVETLADRQETGDLPARVTVLPGQEGSGDEGTALLEIVHDLAPGAELYFATGFTGQAQFAANIEALCEAGADVIVDDIGYFLEANFQDGIIAQGVNAATEGGCYFFSAAGNDGNLNDGTSGVWEGDYAEGSALTVEGETLGVRHNFGSVDDVQEENPVQGGGSFRGTVVLQWSDPLENSANDYDLFLVDGDGNVISSSTNTQDGSQDPFESISTGFFAYRDARLVIVKVKGDDRYLRLQTFHRKLEIATAGNTYGHPGAENAVSVGEVDVRDAGGAGGVFDGGESVDTDSSDGPRRVFFEPDGTPITAGDSTTTGGQEFQELSKPDLTAAGCVSTATPGFSRFCGTSAAAPHAAAIAALMLEAAGGPGHVTLAELRAAMAESALDIEEDGVDRDSGAGIVMAPGALDGVAVAIADRNGAPTVTNTLAERTLAAGSDAATVDLASIFADPDSDTLSYSAWSSDPDRLAVTLSGTVVTLTPGSPGRSVVSVRVTDPGGLGAVETFTVTVTAGNTDYDKDNDGFIEITTLAQLDAVRYDLDGNGLVDGATWRPYYAAGAFPMGALDMGCPPDGCVGYELSADLDFDTDGSGAANSDDTYWNDGAGWAPIGSEDAPFTAVFEGDRHTLTNLFINRPTEDGIGLFGEVQRGAVAGSGVIRNVGLIKVDVTGRDAVGSLFGRTLYGVVIGSHASGRVAGGDQVGGLVGESWGNLIDTYAAVDVSGNQAVGGLVGHHSMNRITTSYATGRVSGAYAVGGLAGATSDFYQLIQASYATGDVSGQGARLSPSDSGFIVCGFVDSDSAETSTGGGVGGLVGSSCGIIEASYATGTVSGDVAVGGLVGSGVYVRAPRSYWDMETSGLRVGVGADDTNGNGVIDGTELQRVGVAGLATAALQAPTVYEGIYGRWNVDLGGREFGDGKADEPWDFGTSTQYPALSVDLNGDDTETWQEFGYQFRTRPSLTATTADGQVQVELSWDAADVSPWTPAPSVTYTVYRDDGSTVESLATGLSGTTYADTNVTTDARYTYWVAAVIAGGEVARSTPAPVTAGAANQPPVATGTLKDVTLPLGADAVAVDVAGAFRDPDDDSLAYTAAASDTSVATVSKSGSQVTITPVGAGRAIVIVTATDTVGSNQSATQRFKVAVGNDYDVDDDRLVEIQTLAQLDAMRLNLDGGVIADDPAAYAVAFPAAIENMGCGLEGCSGYELVADLDFDTNRNEMADSGDTYWNDGAGWAPLGTSEFLSFGAFNTTFDGNDHVIANLFVRGADFAGLFGALGQPGVIRNLSLTGVDVVGVDFVGGLVGQNFGAVIASETTGQVTGDDGAGGLVGENDGTITRSRSFATLVHQSEPFSCPTRLIMICVTPLTNWPGIGGLAGVNEGSITASYATGAVVGGYPAGGLVGYSDGVIVSSYATGPVTGSTVGGLVGRNGRNGRIYASYATGRVSGGLDVGGLVGTNANLINSSYATGPVSRRSSYGGGLVGNGGHLVGASYWDSTTSGISSSRDRGNTTAELQAPIGYNGIYQSWNLDLYGDSARDDPWDFGTTTQYPALSVDFDGDGQATWQEFGHQLRAGPALTADAKQGQAVLAWSAVASGHWTPPPGITYNIYRSKDTTVKTLKTLVENLDALEYTDPDVTDGPYIYQVAAVADGGQATHSARVAASSASNTAPEFPSSETGVRSIPENTAAGVDIGAAVAAIDAEDDPLTYSLDAAGAGFFAIDSSTGQLKTKAPLDYEKTKTHTFTLTVSDYAASDTTTVRVNVTNAEDPGTVTLLPAQPQVGAKLTAGLTDPDTVSGSVGWSWERSPNSTGPWTAISNATSASYTPRADDLNRYLRATASYNDGLGTGRSASGVSANAVAPRPPNTSLSPSASDPSADPSTVVYTVTFEGQWTAAATPGGVPDGAHFSRLIGAVHNSGVTFLRSGGAASAGVESMAEDGGWTGLRDEVMDAGSNALSVLTGDTDNIRPTTSKALTVTLTADHPRVTLLTMVAPSPDWFVGVSGLTLLDAGGDWVESLQVDLFPWDAGTEEGSGFSLSNSATSPQGVITNLRGTGKFSNARIATLTFTRQSVNTAPTGTPTFIGAQRVGEVLRVDTSSIEDLDGLTNPDFRFTWLADDDLMELGSYLRALSCCDGYEIPPYDAGMTIKVQIHFDDDLGNHEVIDLQAPSTVAAAAPDQPGNLSASLGGPGELNLSWSTPALCDFTLSFDCWQSLDRTFNVGDGGSDITGYTVQWKLSSGDWGTASDVSEAEISETSYTITGLVSSNTYTVRVRARNVAGLGTPSTEVTVSGADLNVGPAVSGRARPYFFETNPRDVTTYTATDPESDTITWSLSGDDASFFSIVNGVLNFDSAGDFEDPRDVGGNNAYDLNVVASDGQNTATFPVTVVIFNVEDERPVITGDDTLTFAEYTDTTTILQTYSATDPEGVNTTFTWTLAGTDSGDFEISDAGALTFKNVPDYDSPADSDGDNVYNVQVRAEDATETGRLDVTVTVTNVNEAPTTPTGRDAITVAENTAGNLARYTATDPDKDDTVMWDVSGTDANSFRIDSSGNLAFNGAPNYENPTDSDGNNVYEVSVDAKDAEFTSSLEVTVTVEDVDEPPEIAGATTIDDYDENSTGIVATYTAADPEGASTITWTLGGTDRGDFDITGGVLTFKSAPDYERPADSGRNNEYRIQIRANDGSRTGARNVTVTVSDVNEEPAIVGDATLSYPENTATTRVLDRYSATDPEGRQITWSVSGTDEDSFRIDGSGNLYFVDQPDYDAPSDSGGDNEYNIQVVATDDGNLGDGTPSLLGTLSSSFDVAVTVTAVNEQPTVDGEPQLTIFENDEDFSASYLASDPDGVASTITWSVAGTDRGDFNIDRNTGELTFRNTPNYESPTDSNRDNVYVFTVRATDEGGLDGSLDVTIMVVNVDEPPTITGSATPPDFPENSIRSVATYGATDPEGRTIAWDLSGTDRDDFNIAGGVLTFANIPDFEKPADWGGDNVYNVTVQATDEGGNPASLDVTVTVINSTGAEEPSITTTSRPSLTLQENGTGTIYTFRARDPQGRPVFWSLTGDDWSNFTIISGALTFNGSPDFESPADYNGDNVYELTVVVTDDQGLADSFDFTVTVTNHHENREPAITTSPSSGLTYQKLNYQENLISTVHTYRARNYGSGSIRWSLRGPDFDSFDINELGALTFKSAPNYEAPGALGGDNDYEIAVVASNSGGYSDRLNVVITVTDVNEGPEVSGPSTFTIAENERLSNAVYTARDPEGLDVTRWTVGGRDGGDFTITPDGVLTFRNIPDFERPADSGGDNVYEVTVRPYDGRYYGSFDVTVTVTDVNEPPTITTTSSSATALRQNENVTSRLYTYRATDPEGADTVTWSVGGDDKDFFTIDERGQFSFKEDSPPDYEVPADEGNDNVYDVVVQATDDGVNVDTLDVTVTVREVNEGPEVTSGSPSFTISENQDLPNAVYTGFDPEGGTVTRWTVGGRDGGDFTISQEGVLTFRNIPDFERPADSGGDNVYEVTVRPYDGRYYGSFAVTVTVNDVNERPTITTTSSSATALRQDENVTSRLYTYRATDPEGADTVTWSVGGVDARFFDIDERGQFSFKEENPPDFEQPADSDRNNVYNVVVRATDDDNNTAPLDVTVTVREVNEGPEVTSGSSSFTIDENQDLPNAVYTGFDPEGGSVTRWSAGGTDGGDFTISQEGVLTFRNTPDFERPADSNRDNIYELQVRPYDGRYYGSFDVTVTVNDVNEPPAITTTSSSATALRQNENVTSRLYTYRATDPEGADTVTWSVGGVDARFFTITERGEFSFKEDSPPDFEQPADSGGDNVYNVEIQAEDSGGIEASLPVTVTVRDVNEGPEVTSGSPSFTIDENRDLPSAVYTGFDPEGGTVTRWTVGGTDGGDFTISQEGVLTFRNTPDFERPADSNRDNIYQLQVRPYDGRYYGSFDVTVTVTDVNEPPAITTTSSSATALRQNENVTSRLYTYRATDPEGADTVTWSVEGVDARFFTITERGEFSFREDSPPDFEQPADSGRDNVYNVEIQAEDSGGIEASLDVTVTVANDAEGVEPTITTRRPPATYRENDTRTVYTFRASDPQRGPIGWSLEGNDAEDFTIDRDSSGRGMLAFISPPDYENPEDSDGQNDYELTVIATDQDGHVDRLSFTITVTEVDEGPEVSGPPSFQIDENGSLSNAVYTATDPEGLNVARWSVGGRDGGDFFITQGGTLYFRSPPDYESPADSGRDNVYEVTIQPSDGRNNGAYPVTVTVTDVDEPPEIKSGSKTSFMQPENRTSRLHTYSAADPEGGTVTWAVVGLDAGLFTIDERGQFSFREENPPDFDNPGDVGEDNVYDVTIQARDPQSKTASLPVTVTVTEVNEGPVITRDGNLFGSPPGSVPENTPVTQVLATYTATDPERPGVKITQWSTAGRDGGDFVINALGQLMFRNPPDYERPADSDRDNVYEVTVRASDGRNTGTLEEVQRVTVTGVDEAPIITTTSRTAFTQPEDRTSTLYTFRATDPEGGTVTWAPGGTDGSAFTIDERGALSFTNSPNFESPTDSDQDNVYNVTVQAQDAAFKTADLDVTVTVTDHNEGVEPTITTRRPPATYRENDTRAVYTFRATDPQRDTITWKLEGTDREDFTLAPDSSGRAVLAFRNSPDFESPADADRDNVYELTVVATDPDDNSDRVDFTITVTDHNEGVEPTISTRRPPATYRENDTRTVYTFRASDPQRGTTITWRLDGTDAEDFTLTADDSGRGVLTFNNPPDFENPVDADTNNDYELAVVATDPQDNSDRVDFAIAVTDVNEGPVIRLEGTETTTVPENTADTQVLADYTATDPEDTAANIFRWSTAGRDGGDFVISDLGELRFRSSPDYERPADSDRNNVYEVTVRAYDGRVYGAHDVTVTVTQMNEAPVITTKSRTEFTLRENFTAVLYTYRATDQDEDDAVTWSVEGADGGDFAIYNGILNFRLLPDLENPADEDEDNVYEITVVAADRAGLRDTVDAVITITDQSEGPVISGKTSHTVAENYDITRVLGSYTATDAKDDRPVHPRWSLSGRDGGDFTINEAGELTFRNIPDYDRPADANRDNVYEVTVRGHDSRAYGNLNVTVTVTLVNEHDPVVTGRETLSFRENTTVETRLHTYRATDGDRDTSFTWSLEGDDAGDFLIDEGGVLTFSAPPDYEGPADRDTDNVYRVTVVASDGAQRGTLDVTVTVTEQNEGPVVSGTPEFTVVENQHLPRSAIYTAQDPEAVGGVATTIRWSVSGRDGGDFTIHRDTGLLTFRALPDHERPADANRDNVYEVTVRAHDGRNYGDFQVTVTVEDVAEITGPAAITRTENFEGVLATYLHAGQGDLNVDPSWRLTGADSGDFTIDRESGELTFRSIPDHERPADSNRDNVYNFTVQVSDGSYHGTLDVTVTVDAVNEPPAVTGRDSLSFRENTPVTTRLHTYRATDPEGNAFEWSLEGADASHFTITPDGSGRGVLTFASPPNFDIPSGSGAHVNEYLVTVVASDGTNRGTLDVTVTVTDQNEGAVVTGDQTIAVRENQDPAVTLATYSATDPEGQRITRWSLSGSDGGDFLISANGDLAFRNTPDYDRPADSNRDNEYLVTVRAYDGRTYGNLDVTITVSNVNEHDPVIRSGSRTSFTYREEGTAALYTYRATDGDKDDVIRWTTEGTDEGDFTIGGDTGELTFREPPDYEHPEDSGRDNVYNLTVVATDSGGLTDRLDVTVTVTAVDEGPEVSGATTYTVPEGQELAGATFTARDPEDASAAVTSWRLAGSDAGDFTITDTEQNSAQLTFRNTPDYDRPADSNRNNEYLVTIRAYNGSTYGSLDVTVTVTDRNEAEPVVTGRGTLSFRENTATTTRLHTYRATDTDRDATITWSVRGTDSGDFTISTGGELFFSSIPDHEQAADSDSDNVYEITVVASDSSKEGTMAVTVTVTDVNEGPEIAGTQSLSFDENTATDRVLATYTATDPEDPDLKITRWSVTGRDGGDFSINEDGELTFRNTPDHERPADSGGDNLYEVTVRASDGRVYGAHDVTVTVTPVDEAPEFQRNTQDSFSYRENGTAALYTYRATDPEGAEVAWSVSGADGGAFTIDRNTGVLNFREPPDHDNPADDGRDNEYQVAVVATDQTGRATNLPVTVTVTDVNEGPVIAVTNTNTAITVDENHDQVLAIYTATDPEDPDLEITRWSVTGRDGGDFTINDGGELTFRNPPDHERPADSDRDSVYEVTVRASDGRYYGTLNVTVTVRAVDEAPEFQRNTQDSFVYPENGASAIYTYRATDPEGSDVTWDLSGTDSDAFSIDKTGVLTFKSPPDYENPADTDDDNVYELTVEARDDSNTTPLDVTVTVTNLTDARVVIRGTAQVGRTLTAETSGIPDEDRRDKVDLSYQWLADETGVEGATDPTYEITERDEGKAIKVRVTFTDNAGKEETLTSAATAPVKPAQSNEPAAGLPIISGTAQVGETLTADTSGISDADGMTDAVFRYQWTRWDSDTDEDIEGATDSTYEVSDEDEGKTIRLRVGFSDDRGNDEALTSAATGSVAARPAQLTAKFPASPFQSSRHKGDDDRPQVIVAFNLPVQSFDKTTPSVSLTGATVSSLVRHEEDGLENAWVFFLDPEGNDDVVFTLVAGQSCDAGGICTGEGKMLSEGGTTTLPGPDEEDKPDNTDSNEPNSPATGVPTIGGTAQVGETLTANTSGVADADGLSSVQYEYQWLADDAEIVGATGSTYTLTDSEESKTVKVQVSFTDDAGHDETLTSAATDAVAGAQPTEPPDQPSGLSATASHDSVTLTWDDPGDDSITGYVILRRIPGVDPEGQFDELVADTGTAATTYTDDTVSAETRYTYRIKAINEHGVSERSRWFHIDTLAAPAPEEEQAAEPPAKATGLSSEVSHNMVILTWDDPNDDSITGYLILRRDKDIHEEETFLTVAPDTGSAETTYVDASVEPERRYVYRIKAINASGVSEISSWVRAYTPAVPEPEPEAPAKPTSLSATFSHDSVTLTWDDPGDDSITGYVILRRDKDLQPEEGTFFTVTSDTGSAETTYTDDTAEPDKRYVYRIKAINEHGEMSEISSWVRAYTPAAA